jgi:hypothetical protein
MVLQDRRRALDLEFPTQVIVEVSKKASSQQVELQEGKVSQDRQYRI